MTTSSPEDAPRGMEFLYSLNRLNVATLFFSDTSGVFDQLDFPDVAIAEGALRRNGFARFDEDPEAATFFDKPQPPFVRCPHSNGPIYSSGRFWK